MLARPHDDALDAGPRRTPPGTERFCAASGTVKPVAEMIRFVVGPDGAAVPDLKRRLPGRGIWITATRQALETAVARKAFARSFKRDVRAAADLVDMTEPLDRASRARRARHGPQGPPGRDRLRQDRGRAGARDRSLAVLHAADAAPDGVRKLNAALQQREDAAKIAVIGAFTSAQLDLALGRSNVIHAALLAGPESETFLARAARLDRFREPISGLPVSARTKCAGRR